MINYRQGMGGFNKTFISVLICLLFLIVFFAYQNKVEQEIINEKVTGIEWIRNLYRSNNGQNI